MSKVRFGARIPTSGPVASVSRIKESTAEAEALGYDSAWILDHIHNAHERHKQYPVGMGSWKDPGNTLDPHQFETVSVLSYLAGATRNIEFGVGIMPVPLRDPIVLAKELATLDAMSDGRFIWGVGVSNVSDKQEYRAVGRPFEAYAQRYERMGEYVAAMRAIWENPSATYHGKYVNFDDLVIYPKPARHIPVWIGCYTLAGGRERPAVRFALDHADGWIYGFLMMPHHIKGMIAEFNETARQEKKDMSNFDWCFQLRLSIAETEAEARRNVEWVTSDQPNMGQYAGYMWKRQDTWRDAQGAEEAPKSNLSTAIIGTPDDVRRRVREYIDAGANYFDVWYIYPTYESLMRQMRLFATEVMPTFSETRTVVS
jgi:alkanesulfonate monooxygenase SsuD/methylene tetrahydromethanopterin reductase-like flavin-dependent oxidoreductase (luciferase family)